MLSKQERALIIHWHEEKKASIRTISRRLGVSRNTVRHWLRAESKTEEPKARSQLGKFLQEHAADVREMYVNCELHCPPLRRCIKDRYQVDVPLRMLQRYCAPLRKELKRLTYLEDTVCRFETAPGQHLQVDFGEKDVLVNGQPVHLHLFTCKLGYSRRVFVMAYLRETQEAWLDGMESAFRYFGGLPYCIVCDNASSLVRNHNAGSDAARFTQRFYYFLSYYNIKGIATAIQHPQSKGKVESGVKYVKNNAVVGVDKPDLASWNIWLETWCRTESDQRKINTLFSGPDTPAERWILEKQALRSNNKHSIAGVFFETRKVGRDGLIRVDNQYFRLDDALIGLEVQIQYDEKNISVSRAGKRIATLDKTKDAFNPKAQEASSQDHWQSANQKQFERLLKDPHWRSLQNSSTELARSGADYDAVINWPQHQGLNREVA